jgi:chromosome segregation ATPase
MDITEYLKIAGALGLGGLLAKVIDKILSLRRDDVETEDAINAMAIRQLKQQMEQMAAQIERYEKLERMYEELKEKYNDVIVENTELKMRITQLEKAAIPDIPPGNPKAGLGA